MSSTPEILTCSACLCPEAEWQGSTKGPCGHSMCMPCFMTWIRLGKPSCPLCRMGFGGPPAYEQDQEQEPATAAAIGFFLGLVGHGQGQDQDQDYDNSLETRRRNHRAQVEASRSRRTSYLYDKQTEFRAHCLTCTDAECRKTHDRRMQWLNKGKLTPVPAKLGSLPKCTIGLLLSSTHKTGLDKRTALTRQSEACGERITWRRQAGLEYAIKMQLEAKVYRQRQLAENKGSVVRRLGGSLASAAAALEDIGDRNPTVKIFRGFCLPKRGARTGDLYTNETEKAICTGYNRWTFSNGTVAFLDGKTWRRS